MEQTFKEKRLFYKERQKFFEVVKSARKNEYPVITYNKKRYKLFSVENNNIDDFSFAAVFSKTFKSNMIVDMWHRHKTGLGLSNGDYFVRHNDSLILCYAKELNTEL